MSYQFHFNYQTNSWHLGNSPDSPLGSDQAWHVFPTLPPEGDFLLFGDVFSVSPGATCGLVVEATLAGETEPQYISFTVSFDENMSGVEMTPNGPVVYAWNTTFANFYTELRVAYHQAEGELVFDYTSWPYRGASAVWQHATTIEVDSVSDTGLILFIEDDSVIADGYISQVAEIPGRESDGFQEFYLSKTEWFSDHRYPGPALTSEPVVYGLVGAPFGDLEFDVGKSVRWLEYFCNKVFILDVNLGTPRYWIINWTQTFPNAEHAVTNINYFERPADFRKEQFRLANKAFRMEDDAWTLWVDGTEGLCFDNASLPDDYESNPFMSFIYREIARAEKDHREFASFPFHIYLRTDEVQNVTYQHAASNPDLGIPPVMQAMGVPYYLPPEYWSTMYHGPMRLIKVSALRDPQFPWQEIDNMIPTGDFYVKAFIINYAYAHWQYPDIPPGETEIPPLTEANDLGWQMRKKISKVRPVFVYPGSEYPPGSPNATLPTDVWDPASEPPGVPGPWGKYILTNTQPDFDPITDTPVTEPDPLTLGLKTPLYDTVVRLNMRDGVWYEGDASGNTPLVWDSENEKWTTPYDTNAWPTKGVDAPPNPYYEEPPTPTGALPEGSG